MSDPTSDLEAWAASYRAARRPGPARRRAIAEGLRASIEAEDRRIRRQRWLGIGVLVAAGVLGVLALGQLLDGAGTQVGRADDRSMAPHSAAGEPVHEAREGKVVARAGAAGPGEPGTPSGDELEGTEAPAAASGGAASSELEPRSTPTRRRSGSGPADAPVADAPVADAPVADASPDELESMRLLREAERKLESDAAESLRLLERHAERFPASPLSLEREALTVIALCRVGRAEAGRERQQAFLRRPGSSAYAERVESACEAPASPAR